MPGSRLTLIISILAFFQVSEYNKKKWTAGYKNLSAIHHNLSDSTYILQVQYFDYY